MPAKAVSEVLEAKQVAVEQPVVELTLASDEDGKQKRIEEFEQIVRTYNEVTERLRQSHEVLSGEVVRLQQELARKNSQLERSKRLAALGEMAAGIAHEIRNPLAAIQLYADMIVDDLEASGVDGSAANGEVVEEGLVEAAGPLDCAAGNAGKIVSAVRGLNAIVNDVLSFAREIEPQRKRLNVGWLFAGAVDRQRPVIAGAGVEVVIDEAASEYEVLADGDLLTQALVNLIRNAVEAMSDEGRVQGQGVLRLSAELRGGKESAVVLTVADSGPGIDSEKIDRIFNPFFTTRRSGTGLGLAIVHRIVDAHGGTISVRNKNLEKDGCSGAVFELILPVEVEKGLTEDDKARQIGVEV